MGGGQGTCPASAVNRATTTAERHFREFVELFLLRSYLQIPKSLFLQQSIVGDTHWPICGRNIESHRGFQGNASNGVTDETCRSWQDLMIDHVAGRNRLLQILIPLCESVFQTGSKCRRQSDVPKLTAIQPRNLEELKPRIWKAFPDIDHLRIVRRC